MRNRLEWLAVAGLALVLAACNGTDEQKSAGAPAANPAAAAEGAKYLLAAEPAQPDNVISARETVKQGDEISLVGRIGGSTHPWIDGQAAFTIVDVSLKPCSDNVSDSCPTPWDYCCEPNLKQATALVKVVNEQNGVVKVDARQLLRVAELNTVVVTGTAQRDDAGNLTILARGLFVR